MDHLWTSLFVVPLVLSNKHLQYLISAIPALPFTVNELLTCLLKCDELWKRVSLFSTSPVYCTTATVFYTTINKIHYTYSILTTYLVTTRLKQVLPSLLEQRRHVVLSLSSKRTSVYWHMICVSWLTILSTSALCEEEHFAIYVKSRWSKLLASAIDFSSFIYDSLVGRLLI